VDVEESTLASRLRAYRAGKGWTQRDLATAADVSQAAVAGIEAGRRFAPSAETLLRIAEALGVTMRDLLPRDHSEKSV
jgi:transcriptional regulator with XRE-family HTH domain